MGEHCELMAKRWKVSREAQDALARESHLKLAAAYERGFFNDLMTPYKGQTRDNTLRPEVSLDQLAQLKPVFDRDAGTLTAGNSTPLTDGASAVLLASEQWAAERGLPVQAYLSLSASAAVDFFDKREGLLMAPVHAVPPLLSRAGLALQDFDFTRFTKPSPRRCYARSPHGKTKSIAKPCSDSGRRQAASTARV